jgi:hypothetical protein
MRNVFLAAIAVLIASPALAAQHAKSPTPASLIAIQQMQLREQAGLYSDEWEVEGAAHQEQYDRLVKWAERNGIVVSMAKIAQTRAHARGTTQPGYGGVWVVLLDVGLGVDAKLHTLLHELAHIYGPSPAREQEREVIAELSAAMVCERLGLNVWPQATGYLSARVPTLEVQSWAVQRCATEIDRLVDALAKIARE